MAKKSLKPGAPPMSEAEFQAALGVPDRAMARLRAYLALLRKWQGTVNLVGDATLKDPWRRHFLDSGQLLPILPATAGTVCDIGSGAGFPGLVLAILDHGGNRRYHLVESNARKCAFLDEANRIADAGVVVHNNRIEKIRGLQADLVVARAVAPLEKLLEYAISVLSEHGQCLFLKGKGWREELTTARKRWIMKESHLASLSDPAGTILKLEAISRRDHS